MNEVYFRCKNCQTFMEAGAKLAILRLVNPGIVSHEGEEEPINIEKVLACTEYIQYVPGVKRFLENHKEHTVIFEALDRIYKTGEWLELMAAWEGESYETKPRDFIERMNFTKWEEVEEYLANCENQPVWTEDKVYKEMARVKFEELAKNMKK